MYPVLRYRKNWRTNDRLIFTGTATEPSRNLKVRQFNTVQYYIQIKKYSDNLLSVIEVSLKVNYTVSFRPDEVLFEIGFDGVVSDARSTAGFINDLLKGTVNSRYLEVVGTILYKFNLPEVQIG